MVNMEAINFEEKIRYMQEMGFMLQPSLVSVRIPDAKNILWKGIQYFCKGEAKWLPEYEEIANWLSDNNGRGLICLGTCGRGKSLICAKILPLLLNHYHRLVLSIYDAQEMNKSADEAIRCKLLLIDDLGTENVSVKFGERRVIFPEICDAAEKQGKLLIVTTNLSLSELREKYGERTIDRLKAITKPVLFQGESLRK